MHIRFWTGRCCIAFAFVVIAGAQGIKGHTASYAISEGLIWAATSAGVFAAAQLYRRRRGREYAVFGNPAISGSSP